MLVPALLLAAGIALLYLGGEALVGGATGLARRLGMSSLVIGLTVVAFGTSAPELAATLTATLDGSPNLGLGNVVGSNIANIGLILGISALLVPLVTTTSFILRELPFMIGCSALLFPLAGDDNISRFEGASLCVLLLLYLGFLYWNDSVPEPDDDDDEEMPSLRKSLGLVALGSVVLVGGAKLLVMGGVDLARDLGISERVIGLTMVAIGTSLPELASSLVAARKGETDLVLGNVVGSNVFNVLCILGVTSLVRPMDVDGTAAQPDLVFGLILSGLVIPFVWSGRRLGRGEGLTLLVLWLGYIVWLFVRGAGT